jgi:hypothetical protein
MTFCHLFIIIKIKARLDLGRNFHFDICGIWQDLGQIFIFIFYIQFNTLYLNFDQKTLLFDLNRVL